MFAKEEIIREVQRTAKENGGIPLGVARFRSQTGITIYDWMKYWARFDDVQKAAGFSPNTKYIAYENEVLFKKFISLARELGKIPVKGDIVVKHNQDSTFPTDKAFYRIGKNLFLSKLLQYAEKRKYKDIVDLCKNELGNNVIESSTLKESFGYVYLVKSGKYYKIGKTFDLVRRGKEIKMQLPESLELVHEIKTDDPSGIETYWHKRFETKRKNGEWFDLNSSEVKAFIRWRKIA